jgi:hypothetical protein
VYTTINHPPGVSRFNRLGYEYVGQIECRCHFPNRQLVRTSLLLVPRWDAINFSAFSHWLIRHSSIPEATSSVELSLVLSESHSHRIVGLRSMVHLYEAERTSWVNQFQAMPYVMFARNFYLEQWSRFKNCCFSLQGYIFMAFDTSYDPCPPLLSISRYQDH